jgi:hypothetical protein
MLPLEMKISPVTALKAAGLVGALQAEGPFTVFAPRTLLLLKLILK